MLVRLALVLLATAAPAHAQTVVGRAVEFVRSADHARLLPDGRPAVSEYHLEIYTAGAAAPFHWITLGKPAPAADGVIRFDFSGLVGGWPLPGGVYEARVSAIGPLGTGRSAVSNPFTLATPGCAPSVAPATVPVGAGSSASTVRVTAAAGCGWTTSSGASWIAVSPASGSGSATVTIAVAANPSPTPRTGVLTIAGTPVTVSQAGAMPPRLSDPASPLVIGGANTVSGTSFTAGSVVMLYVATGAGPVTYGPYKPTNWNASALTWVIPREVAPGNGFAAVRVVNTDTGYLESNLVGALLTGSAAAGLPTVTQIDGVGLSPADLATPVAHIDTVVAKGATITLAGTGFRDPVVNVFTVAGNIGPLTPRAGGSATRIQVVIPSTAPTGPGSFQVVNRPGYQVSAAVSAVIGAVPTISRVTVSGGTITVTGTGFSATSVINLFNTQGSSLVNLGGFGPRGPKVPLTIASDTRFTFARPAGAMAGPTFVEVLNPPFIPFSSSGADPDGAFTMGEAPPPLWLTDAAAAAGPDDSIQRHRDGGVAGTGGELGEPVRWTRAVNARVEGETLGVHPSASEGGRPMRPWRAGARSTQAILDDDGHVAWDVTEHAGEVAFGLGNDDADGTLADIAYAWRLDAATRELVVYERGVRQAAVGTYAAGDRLRVAVRDGVVEYWRNGAVVWVSRQAPRYPLVADASLGGPASRLGGVRIAGRLGAVVDWSAQPGVAVASMRATLARRVPGGRRLLDAGATTAAPGVSRAIAVSAELAGDAGIGVGSGACDYCLVRSGGNVEVRHDGAVRGTWPAEAGARYRVEVAPDGVVRYWVGDLLLDEAPTGTNPTRTVRGWLGSDPGSAIVGAAVDQRGRTPGGQRLAP